MTSTDQPNSVAIPILNNRALANAMWTVFRKAGLGPLILRAHPKSALVQIGWWRSFRQSRPIDRAGNTIPWWSYGAIEILRDRIKNTHRILEFGAGNSTLWLAARAGEVVSLENNSAWLQEMQRRSPENVSLIMVNSFSESHVSPAVDGCFDIVTVDCDGDRESVIMFASDRLLNETGVIIWDDTDRPRSKMVLDVLAARGFRELPFSGLSAQSIHLTTTSIFYRTENCLGI